MRITEDEIVGLRLAVELAKAAATEILECPDSQLAKDWCAAEVADGGEVVSHLFPGVLDQADALVTRLERWLAFGEIR